MAGARTLPTLVMVVVVAACSAGDPAGQPAATPTTIDPAIATNWDDAASIEVGGVVAPLPTDDHHAAVGAGVPGVFDGFQAECRRRTAAASGPDVAGVDEACASLATPLLHWDPAPSADDQASRLLHDVEVAEHDCLVGEGMDLPGPPAFDTWVADGGVWTAESDLPLGGFDTDHAMAAMERCREESSPTWPLPTWDAGLAVEGTDEISGEFTFGDHCLHLVDADGMQWLPVWPEGSALTTLLEPGRIGFEVWDEARFEADVVAGTADDEAYAYTLLRPATAATLRGTTGGVEADTGGCTGAPFLVSAAEPDR